MSVLVRLEAWLVADGKVGSLKRGDVLVCGLEIFVHEMSPAALAADRQSIRRVEDGGDTSGTADVRYEIVGHAVSAGWFRGDLWLLEASGIQLALTGLNPPPPMPTSAMRVRGSAWVPWRYLHQGPLTRAWRVDRIFLQTGSANDQYTQTGPETTRPVRRHEIDHIEQWPDGIDRPYGYLLDLTPLDLPAPTPQ
jgi:hypothetical protein